MLPEDEFFAPAHFQPGSRVLDVGCGEVKKVPWATGLDRVPTAAADVVHDLDRFPWPFEPDTFDAVVASHVVEHVADVLAFCRELHRICRDGAQVRIATPHFSNPDAFADPTHRHQLGYRSFEFVSDPASARLPELQRRLNGLFGMQASVAGWYTNPGFEIVERRITFRKPHRLLGLDRFAQAAPLMYEYFLGGLAPARDLQVVLRVVKRG